MKPSHHVDWKESIDENMKQRINIWASSIGERRCSIEDGAVHDGPGRWYGSCEIGLPSLQDVHEARDEVHLCTMLGTVMSTFLI